MTHDCYNVRHGRIATICQRHPCWLQAGVFVSNTVARHSSVRQVKGIQYDVCLDCGQTPAPPPAPEAPPDAPAEPAAAEVEETPPPPPALVKGPDGEELTPFSSLPPDYLAADLAGAEFSCDVCGKMKRYEEGMYHCLSSFVRGRVS